jgi:hypothetical protein
MPGWGSIAGVLMASVVALLAPMYAVLAFADGHDLRGALLAALAGYAVVQVAASVRLQRRGRGSLLVSWGFTGVCAVVAVVLITGHHHPRLGLLLGVAAAGLALLVTVERFRGADRALQRAG